MQKEQTIRPTSRWQSGWELWQQVRFNYFGLNGLTFLSANNEKTFFKIESIIGKVGTIQEVYLSNSTDGSRFESGFRGDWLEDDYDIEKFTHREPYKTIINLARQMKESSINDADNYKHLVHLLKNCLLINKVWIDQKRLLKENALYFLPFGKNFLADYNPGIETKNNQLRLFQN